MDPCQCPFWTGAVNTGTGTPNSTCVADFGSQFPADTGIPASTYFYSFPDENSRVSYLYANVAVPGAVQAASYPAFCVDLNQYVYNFEYLNSPMFTFDQVCGHHHCGAMSLSNFVRS